MGLKEVYIGSIGPFLYDDSETYSDGEYQEGFRTSGSIRVEGAPTDNYHVPNSGQVLDMIDASKTFRVHFLLGGL